MSTDNGTRRDPASLTRVQITRRTSTSSDTLAHPLLSPTPSSMSVAQAANTTPNHLTGASALNNASPTRYVPYTPRHRVAAAPSAPATTSTTTQSILPAPSHQSLGTATNKLLLQNLKAAAQVELGLNNDSIGWHLLEFLANETGGNDWDDVWTLLTAEKVCAWCLVLKHYLCIYSRRLFCCPLSPCRVACA